MNMSPTLSASFVRARAQAKLETTSPAPRAVSPACKFGKVTDLRLVRGGGDLRSSVSHWLACSSPRHVRSSSKKNLSHMLARGADEGGPLDGRCDVVLAADALLVTVTQLEASLLQHPHSGELGPDAGLAQDPADARPARSASLSQPRLASMPRQASMLCRL